MSAVTSECSYKRATVISAGAVVREESYRRRGRVSKKGWYGDRVFDGGGRRRGVYPADGISGGGRTTFRRVWLSAYHPC